MQLDRKEIESALMKKGFERRKGPHTYFYHTYEGKYSGIRTHTSRGTKYKSYGRGLLGAMKKQLRLSSSAQLKALVKCPMSGDDYNKILKQSGLL